MDADSKSTYGGFWVRAGAFALDYIVIAIYLVFLVILALTLNRIPPSVTPTLFANEASAHISGFLLVTLPVLLYFALFESSAWEATLGKRVMHLQVVGANGARVSIARAVVRNGVKFIPWELAHTLIWQVRFAPDDFSVLVDAGFVLVWVLVGVYVVTLAISKTHQAVYDMVAGTFVIKQLSADVKTPMRVAPKSMH